MNAQISPEELWDKISKPFISGYPLWVARPENSGRNFQEYWGTVKDQVEDEYYSQLALQQDVPTSVPMPTKGAQKAVTVAEKPVQQFADPEHERVGERKSAKQYDFAVENLEIPKIGNLFSTVAGQVIIWFVYVLLLIFVDWLTNIWMLADSSASFGAALAKASWVDWVFALLIMPSEVYLQIVNSNLERVHGDARLKFLLWVTKIVVSGMIVYDAVATFVPPFVSQYSSENIGSSIGGALLGAFLSVITLLASMKIMEQTFIMVKILRGNNPRAE